MNDKIKTLLAQYDQQLGDLGVVPVASEDRYRSQYWALGHARWMLVKMLAEADNWPDHKNNRWLGFVQGILWMTSRKGILTMRDETRGIF